MRATRNRVYRKLYRGFESPYLRQEFAPRLCGENLWRTYWAWTKRPQPLVAGFGTSAQWARSERGPRTKFVGITIPLSPPSVFATGKAAISGFDVLQNGMSRVCRAEPDNSAKMKNGPCGYFILQPLVAGFGTSTQSTREYYTSKS